MVRFLTAYIKSMRPYYSFVTGIAGWIGVSYYEYIADNPFVGTIETPPSSTRKMIILGMLFMSWGVNQIINDLLGLREDRINAPERPMVTGELNPGAALALSVALLAGCALITWFYLEPIALVFLVAGVGLNVVYEHAKGYGVWGNVVFGLMITMAPLYGGYASGPTGLTAALRPHRISVLLMVFVLNALMTFYTYFKDYEGDRLAGKRTLVVLLGPWRSRWVAIGSALLPTLVFVLLRVTGIYTTPLNRTFYVLATLTVGMQFWTGVLYYRNPVGPRSYHALSVNFRACTCGQAALIAIFNPDLALWLFLFTYIMVDYLFRLHANPRA
jgi:geranylgeranylglycerol-phosphate geranylgeranyltransferase